MFVRGIYQALQNSIPRAQGKQDELVSKEETKLKPDTEIEDVISSHKKSTQKLFRERSKTTTSTIETIFGKIYLRSVVYEDCGIQSRKSIYAPHQSESHCESFLR